MSFGTLGADLSAGTSLSVQSDSSSEISTVSSGGEGWLLGSLAWISLAQVPLTLVLWTSWTGVQALNRFCQSLVLIPWAQASQEQTSWIWVQASSQFYPSLTEMR